MITYSTEDLLATIKQRGMVPSNQSTWQTADFLRTATEIMRLDLMGILASIQEEYFVTSKDYVVPSGETRPRFRMPNRASSMAIKGVYFIESDGSRIPIPRVDRDIADYSYTGYRQTSYYLEWNDIVLITSGGFNNTEKMQVDYYIEPGKLVEASRAARIESVAGNVLTIDAVPSVFSTGSLYDLISADGGREYYDIDLSVSGIDTITNQMTFNFLIPSGVRVGDYVSLAGESPTPQLPNALQPVLANMVCAQVLESLGFGEQADKMSRRANSMVESALKTLTPRVQGSARKIVTGFTRRTRFDR